MQTPAEQNGRDGSTLQLAFVEQPTHPAAVFEQAGVGATQAPQAAPGAPQLAFDWAA